MQEVQEEAETSMEGSLVVEEVPVVVGQSKKAPVAVVDVVDLEVADQEINNKTRIRIINKIILEATKDNSEDGGAREVKASKGSKVILYVIIVEVQVICRLLVIGGKMI